MSTSDTAYIPGVCNINHAEIARRRSAGYLGLSLFVVVLLLLLFFIDNRIVRLILVAPAFLGAIGFLQARAKFCVGYAAAGLQNASKHSKTATAVTDPQATLDKKRARKMNLQAVVIALTVTVVSLTIPHL